MKPIDSIAALDAIYDSVPEAAVAKVTARLTPHYRAWVETARFVILSTVGPGGTDASPRGDRGPVVQVVDDKTLLLPDWRGNNRLDSLRNIVTDGRLSLMFMVPGSGIVVRINGRGQITEDADLRGRFDRDGTQPRTVIVVSVCEVYFQCPKAIMRAELWSDVAPPVPTAGDFIAEMKVDFDAKAHDAGYADYARPRMW